MLSTFFGLTVFFSLLAIYAVWGVLRLRERARPKPAAKIDPREFTPRTARAFNTDVFALSINRDYDARFSMYAYAPPRIRNTECAGCGAPVVVGALECSYCKRIQ
jgi:hypothetical protein